MANDLSATVCVPLFECMLMTTPETWAVVRVVEERTP